MIGMVVGIFVWLGVVIAFFWALDALRTLKDGQLEILKRLERLESSLGERNAAESRDDEYVLPTL